MNKNESDVKNDLQAEFDSKSLQVRKLGPEQHNFHGSVANLPEQKAGLNLCDNSFQQDDRLKTALLSLSDNPNNNIVRNRLVRLIEVDVWPHLQSWLSPAYKNIPDLDDAKNETYEWAFTLDPATGLPRILSFKGGASDNVCQNLAGWLYRNIYSRLKAIARSDCKVSYHKFHDIYEAESHLDQLAQPDSYRNFSEVSSSSENDNSIEQLANQDFFAKFLNYLDEDPDGHLRACRSRDGKLNAFDLVRIQLNSLQPLLPVEIADILGVKHEVFYAFWRRRALPLLRKIKQEIFDESIEGSDIIRDRWRRRPLSLKKEGIREVGDGSLENIMRKHLIRAKITSRYEGNYSLAIKELKLSMEKLKSSRKNLFPNNVDISLLAETIFELARCLHHVGQLDEARTHFKDCIRLYQRLDFPLQEAAATAALGNLEMQMGYIQDAQEHLQTSLAYYQSTLNESTTAADRVASIQRLLQYLPTSEVI
jgi:tetratricopeptide (TPR) repeat protein